MIDRALRDKAAVLIRRLGDGMITSDEFEDEWPRPSDDRALKAIAATLWGAYSDISSHKLEGSYALNEYGRALFDRCILFLESDLEYAWPRNRLYGEKGIPLTIVVLSLGMLFPLYLMQKRHYVEQEAAGDRHAWPFIRRLDYEREHAHAAERSNWLGP